MSAPAAVAIAKLNFPETEESVLKEPEDVRLERGQGQYVNRKCKLFISCHCHGLETSIFA